MNELEVKWFLKWEATQKIDNRICYQHMYMRTKVDTLTYFSSAAIAFAFKTCQILQSALSLFGGFFPCKLSNIAIQYCRFYWAHNRSFFLPFSYFFVENMYVWLNNNHNSDIQLPTAAEDTIQTAQITSMVGSPNGYIYNYLPRKT